MTTASSRSTKGWCTISGWAKAYRSQGKLNPRRTRLEEVLHDIAFAPGGWELLGSPRDGHPARVVNLDVRRAIVSLPLPGKPQPGRGAS